MGDTDSGRPGGLIRAGAGMVAVLVAAATVGHTMDVGPTRAAKEAVRRNWEGLERAVTAAFLGGFVAFYAALAWRTVRGTGYDSATYLRDCVLISFVLVCVASAKYYPWYLGMFFPLALWLPEGDRLRRVVRLADARGPHRPPPAR